MKIQDLVQRVDSIIAIGHKDDEQAHAEEDQLLAELVKQYAPLVVVTEIDRLSKAEFARWYA